MSEEPKTPWAIAAAVISIPRRTDSIESIIKAACDQHAADLRAEVDRLQRQAAAMRSAIEIDIQHVCYDVKQYGCLGDILQRAIDKALATDAGRGYVPLEWARELEHALELVCRNDNWDQDDVQMRLAKWRERTKEGK